MGYDEIMNFIFARWHNNLYAKHAYQLKSAEDTIPAEMFHTSNGMRFSIIGTFSPTVPIKDGCIDKIKTRSKHILMSQSVHPVFICNICNTNLLNGKIYLHCVSFLQNLPNFLSNYSFPYRSSYFIERHDTILPVSGLVWNLCDDRMWFSWECAYPRPNSADYFLGYNYEQVLMSHSKKWPAPVYHYIDVIMGTMASQITSLTIVYSNVYSDADQRSASLAFAQWVINYHQHNYHQQKMAAASSGKEQQSAMSLFPGLPDSWNLHNI